MFRTLHKVTLKPKITLNKQLELLLESISVQVHIEVLGLVEILQILLQTKPCNTPELCVCVNHPGAWMQGVTPVYLFLTCHTQCRGTQHATGIVSNEATCDMGRDD